jgi:23S rRNA pseudouridine1911/1915/1917 synthase
MGRRELTKRSPKSKPNELPTLKALVGAQLMEFLLANLPGKNRNNIKSLLNHKQVLVNGKPIGFYNHQLQPGDVVTIQSFKAPAASEYPGMTIVYEDEALVVIDKHAGMLSISTEGKKQMTVYSLLSSHVKKQDTKNKIFVVHRLDRETSGLMVYAKNKLVKDKLQENWQSTLVERAYLAIIEGKPERADGVITSYLKESSALKVYSSQNPDAGQRAVTHYKTIKSNDKYSMLKVNLETGRKNQIRVHMQDINHPIIGDVKYGSTVDPIERLGLHAWVLSFIHPVTAKNLRFESHIPRKFISLF